METQVRYSYRHTGGNTGTGSGIIQVEVPMTQAQCISFPFIQVQLLAVLYSKEVELLSSVQLLGFIPVLVIGDFLKTLFNTAI